MSETEAVTMPHAQELEDILAIEQPNLAPKIIERLKGKLPKGEHNFKNILINATMGRPVRV